MNKELEYEFNNFANLLNKDCMNLMECLKKQDKDNKPILYLGKHFKKIILPYEEYQKLCNRLESIDNANPSEALECLEQFINEMTRCLENPKEYVKGYEKQIFWKYKNTLETTIKQALLKAQEHNSTNIFKGSKEVKIEIPESSLMDYNPVKQYLKWEDLEFKAENSKQNMAVLLNGTKYTLVVGCNVHFDKLAILRNGGINYYFLEADKQFFNDLHLERVEE